MALVQEYVDDLTLVDGHKFDFRVYVLVTTTDPLLVYIYPEGLGRVAYHKYQSPNEKNEGDNMTHLTNAAINNDWTYSQRISANLSTKEKMTTIMKYLSRR